MVVSLYTFSIDGMNSPALCSGLTSHLSKHIDRCAVLLRLSHTANVMPALGHRQLSAVTALCQRHVYGQLPVIHYVMWNGQKLNLHLQSQVKHLTVRTTLHVCFSVQTKSENGS